MNYTETYIKDIKSIFECIPNIEFFKNKSILITGANGLICSAIVDSLVFLNKIKDFGIHVYAAGRNIEKLNKRFNGFVDLDFFHIVHYDAMEKFELNEKIDYIIHGASPANPFAYGSIPVETILTNVQGTNNLLDYSINNHVEKLVYISSSEVYGQNNHGKPYVEDDYGYVDLLNSRSCYPLSKRTTENLCVSYLKEYGLKTLIVRPGHIYGPTMTESDNRVSSQFPRDAVANKDIVMKSQGTQLRSYCYVLDCVSAILTVLIRGVEGEAYNISNPNSIVTIKQMAETVANYGCVKLVYDLPNEHEKNNFNQMDNSSLDSTKLENLGWEGLFTIKKGIENTMKILKGI